METLATNLVLAALQSTASSSASGAEPQAAAEKKPAAANKTKSAGAKRAKKQRQLARKLSQQQQIQSDRKPDTPRPLASTEHGQHFKQAKLSSPSAEADKEPQAEQPPMLKQVQSISQAVNAQQDHFAPYSQQQAPAPQQNAQQTQAKHTQQSETKHTQHQAQHLQPAQLPALARQGRSICTSS